MAGVVTALSAVGAATVSVSAIVFNLVNIRTADFKRVSELHEALTTGRVAEARHVVGTAFEDKQGPVVLDVSQMEAMFSVLWCFERVDVARSTLIGQSRLIPRWLNSRAALDRSIHRHVKLYVEYLKRGRYRDGELEYTATVGDAGLLHLARDLGIA